MITLLLFIKAQVQISLHNLPVHYLIAAHPVERSNFYSTSPPDTQE